MRLYMERIRLNTAKDFYANRKAFLNISIQNGYIKYLDAIYTSKVHLLLSRYYSLAFAILINRETI